MPESADRALPEEDAKLVTLARSAEARARGHEGAAVRDGSGRTYVASSVRLRTLTLSALQAALAAALSSGATEIEAAVVVTEARTLADRDRAVLDEMAVPHVLLVTADGATTIAQ
jgi:cytidine deaminase